MARNGLIPHSFVRPVIHLITSSLAVGFHSPQLVVVLVVVLVLVLEPLLFIRKELYHQQYTCTCTGTYTGVVVVVVERVGEGHDIMYVRKFIIKHVNPTYLLYSAISRPFLSFFPFRPRRLRVCPV